MTPTPTNSSPAPFRLAIPKGRMHDSLVRLLADAGIALGLSSRGYRPTINLPDTEVKILKPQNIIEMLASGSRDAAFAGADWVAELQADLVEVFDTGLDKVRIVAAAPRAILESGKLPNRPLRIASEYQRLTTLWAQARGQGDRVVRSYGATEVFPPEDADCIVDVTQTGSTLDANGLAIVADLHTSSTRLYASKHAWADPAKRQRIEDLAMLLKAVLQARSRVMLELNVSTANLEAVVAVLPCMREPTMAKLHGDAGYAVKSAVPRAQLPTLIPLLKSKGGTDIVISPIAQIVV
jgi:ATP phosphoribosyltransferase